VASRAQITRLAQRIEDLAEQMCALQPKKVVRIIQEEDRGETEEEAIAKRLAQHPEDAGAFFIISVFI
jgi:ribosomal 50S subunit-associated protein YjgA (DUF615 family)